MNTLFFKIFGWFWLSQALLLGATVLYFVATREPPVARHWRDSTDNALILAAQAAVALHENESYRVRQKTGQHGRTHDMAAHEVAGHDVVLRHFFERTEQATHMREFLFDARGIEVSGRETPSAARDLAKQALNSADAQYVSFEGRALSARRVAGAQGSHYVLVALLSNGLPLRDGGIPPFSLPRTLILLGVGMLVSYAMARYLAAPVDKLRTATQRLADGDLTARVGHKIGRRRDELADLGRDFDVMAERIEALMVSERRLLADISHELRSPLARLNVALELAEQSAPPETQSFLTRIERESGRLNDMIGQLLTLIRLESGAEAAPRSIVNLSALVEEVAADANFEARSRACSVHVAANERCCTLGIPDLLRSALENIVRNAVRYTSEGTTVEISLSCRAGEPGSGGAEERRSEAAEEKGNRGDKTNDITRQSSLSGFRRSSAPPLPGSPSPCPGEVMLTVRDHGPGVPEEALGNLFRPFYRVADARDRQSGGTGLGLSIAERAVRSHGGSLVARNAPDGGLIVEMCLPVTQEEG